MKKLLLLIFILVPIFCSAQFEAAWWFFGQNASLDFNSGAPVPGPTGSFFTVEGSGSISDPCGALLMYSDGSILYDRNGNIMPNGNGLLGNISSAQSVIIIPDLDNSDRYFVITVSGSSTGVLAYSIVDMTLNGGLGDIVSGMKNIILLSNYNEKVTATLNDSGTSYWIVTGLEGVYNAFPTGGGMISAASVITSSLPVTNITSNNRGYLRLSPDGSRLMNTHVAINTGDWMMDFDNATGIVSNPILITNPGARKNFYGAEFSPDSKLLYLNANLSDTGNTCGNSNTREILQYNINSGTGWNSAPFVLPATGANSGRGALQLGVDGKIYHARTCENWLGVVNNPNVIGVGAGYVDDGVALTTPSREGLPPFVTSFFEPSFSSYESVAGGGSGGASINQTNFCDQSLIQFEASSTDLCPSTTLLWDFGDSSTPSTLEDPVYTYLSPGVYTVTLTVTNGGFSFVSTKDITIFANPIANNVADVSICDSEGDGMEMRDLQIVESPQVLGTQTDPNFEIEYFLSQSDADSRSAAITLPYNFLSGTTRIYYRISNDGSTSVRPCFDTGFFDVTVGNAASTASLSDLRICDDNNDGFAIFDLTSVEEEILSASPSSSYIITYYNNAGDAATGNVAGQITNPNNYTNSTINTERIFIRVVDNDPSGCTSTTEVDIFVDATPIAGIPANIVVCDDPSNDGVEDVDLSLFNPAILNGQTNPNFVVTYHDSQANADADINSLASPYAVSSTTPNLFARIDNGLNNDCFTTSNFQIVVSPSPNANPVDDMVACDDVANDGTEVFNLSMANSQVLGSQNTADFNITYHASQADADANTSPLPFMYFNDSANPTETIYVRIESVTNALCADTNNFTITVSQQPNAGVAVDKSGCDDMSNDGVEEFDFSTVDVEILNGQSAADFTVTYHTSQANANTGTNAIAFPFTNTSQSQTIFARIENNVNTDCFDTSTFEIEVFERPEIENQGPITICAGVDELLDAGAGFTSYLWSTGESTQTITVNSGGVYNVTVLNADGCDATATITVIESALATIQSIAVDQFEVSTNQITVTVTGSGDYEYSLDDYVYQNSPRFSNLNPGFYTVYVKDKNGCETVSMDVAIIGAPPYFTPNQDGFHDTWQVIAIDTLPDTNIYIFNRFGKLLKKIDAHGIGWDGTYNGNPMPSSDYWYLIELSDGRIFKGHFALKR